MDHIDLTLMPMNLNLKDNLKYVMSTLSAYHDDAHHVTVACCFDVGKVLCYCFGQIIIIACVVCNC